MVLDKFNLTGKTAIVTGSNRGIGQYYARALAEAGADIIGVSYECDFEDSKKWLKPPEEKCLYTARIFQTAILFINL